MIDARGLTRRFKVKRTGYVDAVRGLDLRIGAGELVAFLGPNGAGKSTTLRMLTTLIPPTSGSAVVAGCDIRADPAGARRRIGYVGQGHGAGDYFRVRDEMVTQGRCYRMSRRGAGARADELLEMLDLTALATRTAASLSGGQRRRLDLAIGLMHRPDLLFLDEPSTGLDPQNRMHLAEHIRRLHDEFGTTVFFSTHYLDEADALAERVLVIDHGRVIADDSPTNLKARHAGDRVTLTFHSGPDAVRAAAVMGGAHDVALDGVAVSLRTGTGAALVPDLIVALQTAGVPVGTADVHHPTLDDVFLALTGRRIRDGASPDATGGVRA